MPTNAGSSSFTRLIAHLEITVFLKLTHKFWHLSNSTYPMLVLLGLALVVDQAW
jgi:hypothetical protein